MLTSEDFANILRKCNRNTPYTYAFENERDAMGKRKYAQKANRWWDGSTGMQKEHIVCWFARKYYSDGSTAECMKVNLNKNCPNCYFTQKGIVNCDPQVMDAETVFNHMGRPEMYLWIAEALHIMDDCKLEDCILDLKRTMDENPSNWRVIKKHITWKDVKKKILI